MVNSRGKQGVQGATSVIGPLDELNVRGHYSVISVLSWQYGGLKGAREWGIMGVFIARVVDKRSHAVNN